MRPGPTGTSEHIRYNKMHVRLRHVQLLCPRTRGTLRGQWALRQWFSKGGA